MLTIRRDEDIHRAEGDWFDARWHFSFSGYHDPEQMGVGALRVFNDDSIIAGAAWPMHPHRDLESLTYVVEGSFEHADRGVIRDPDSLDGGVLEPGAAQVMRFSSEGALHSERNGSEDHPLRFIQLWILPSDPDLASSVQQRQYTTEQRTDRWLQIMGPTGEEGLDLAQDARVLVSRLTADEQLKHAFDAPRAGYVYVIDGAVALGGDDRLAAGDAIKIPRGPERVALVATETAELILVDVPVDFEPVGVWANRMR